MGNRTDGPALEVDAQAQPNYRINPIDLGTVLVPGDWLLLTSGQKALLDVAAISRNRDIPAARLRAWFEGGKSVESPLALIANERVTRRLELPWPGSGRSTALHVTLSDGRRELWRKDIRTMLVAVRPSWPLFGAIETKLRYDAPISVKDAKTGTYSSLAYDQAWDGALNDVVIFLPNGARFVFWRGSSYAPFWAGLHNTGFSYQWAETIPPRGYVDTIEPLQDKELRHSRVRIVESSSSRVHVRWTYQPIDGEYRSLGDQVAEDFYFYPDGFGTRVVTLESADPQHYTFSEFIVLMPQAVAPLEILPEPVLGMLSPSSPSMRVVFPVQPGSFAPMDIPFPTEKQGVNYHPVERIFAQFLRLRKEQGREITAAHVERMSLTLAKIACPSVPFVYRIAQHKADPATAVYFSPWASKSSLLAFKPVESNGEVVSPAYWGGHWPLARGAMTAAVVDGNIWSSPSHLSLADLGEPEPLSTDTRSTVDALGNARQMTIEKRAWLIAKTDASDAELLRWAQSFSSVPSLELSGASTALPSYSPERRAIRLMVKARVVQVHLKPVDYLINPVFELEQAPRRLERVTLNGDVLGREQYEWDGATLWVKAAVDARGARIALTFR